MNEQATDDLDQIKSYTMKVEERLHKKLENHLKILRHIEHHSQTKQQWVIDAIKTKMKREKNISKDMLPHSKRISLRFTTQMDKKIQALVDIQKKLRNSSYSKKQWIADAIYEKLEEEESMAREFLNSLSTE